MDLGPGTLFFLSGLHHVTRGMAEVCTPGQRQISFPLSIQEQILPDSSLEIDYNLTKCRGKHWTHNLPCVSGIK